MGKDVHLDGPILALLVVVGDRDPVLRVVLGDEILQDGVGLPDGKVVLEIFVETRIGEEDLQELVAPGQDRVGGGS